MKLSIHYSNRAIILFYLVLVLLLNVTFAFFANNLETFFILQGLWGAILLLLFFLAIKQKSFSVVHINENKIELKHFGKILQSYPLDGVYIHFAILFTQGNTRREPSYDPCLVFSKHETNEYLYGTSAPSKKSDRFLLAPRKKDLEKLLSLLPRPIVLPTWITLEDYLTTVYDNLNAFERIETFYGLIARHNQRGGYET